VYGLIKSETVLKATFEDKIIFRIRCLPYQGWFDKWSCRGKLVR